jgi:hypothetical protein
MKLVRTTAVATGILCSLAAVVPGLHAPARAHSWYPHECCSGEDCAPVDNIAWLVPAGGGLPQLVVTSKHGTAVVPRDFPVRQSKDSRMHVCLQHSPTDPFSDITVLCLFMPPSM